MRFLIAAAGLMLTASIGLAGEAATTTTTVPQVSTIATTGEIGTAGEAALTPAPTQAKKAYGGYEGCHHARQAKAPLLMY